MARRHGLHALTVLLGMTTAQLPRSRPGTLTPAARQMIASVRGVTPGARGPDPIIDRIDRATKAELESCKAWASRGDLPHQGQAMKCPINTFFSAVALNNTRGTVPEARYRRRSFVPPRGWGLPRDAVRRRAAQTFRSPRQAWSSQQPAAGSPLRIHRKVTARRRASARRRRRDRRKRGIA